MSSVAGAAGGAGLVGAGIQLFSGFTAAGGAEEQAAAAGGAASYQAQVARNNAIIAGYNATEAEEAGSAQAAAVGLKGAEGAGKIKTAQAASGVDVNSGSTVRVQQSQREVANLDTETVLHNAELAAYGYRNQQRAFTEQAGLEDLTAQQAPIAGEEAETGDILGGVGGAISTASSVGLKWGGAPPGGAAPSTGAPALIFGA